MESFITTLLTIVLIYWLLGLLFSIIFLIRGIEKVDEAAKGSNWWFKLLVLPGMTIFWPLFLVKWLGPKK